MKAILESIPYLELHDLDLIEAGAGLARLGMAFRPEMTNHVGILHAGALYTLAETTAGVAAVGAVPGAIILLRSAAVRYLEPGRGDVVAEGLVDAEAALHARDRFTAEGRADLDVKAIVTTNTGEVLLEGSFDYALRRGS